MFNVELGGKIYLFDCVRYDSLLRQRNMSLQNHLYSQSKRRHDFRMV